jgi:DNA-directed RNA polymerase specialized sigma24 family protein
MPRTAPPSPTTDTGPVYETIDINARYLEIRKLVIARFGRAGAAKGVDIDDLTQDVCFKIHRANLQQSNSRFSPQKGSFGKYVNVMGTGQLCEILDARARHPLSTLDCPDSDVVDTRYDPEAASLSEEESALAAMDGDLHADDEDEDDDQILIAATCGPVFTALEPALEFLERSAARTRCRPPRRPAAATPRATQSDWLRGSADNDSLAALLTAAADNDATKEKIAS